MTLSTGWVVNLKPRNELDFIPPKGEARRTGINYDIKYRMGKELEGEE
jgi:hypothetical protein